MWIGFVVGWVIASIALYAYLAITAREPRQPECMDCRLSDCRECPLTSKGSDARDLRRAA